MTAELPLAVQLCPFSDYLETGLRQRLRIFRWYGADESQRAEFLAGPGRSCRIVVTGGHLGCSPDLFSALPALELISINGVGYDKVDLGVAALRGVGVTNTPDVLTEDVADLALGLVIGLFRGVASGDAHVRAGKWPVGEVPLGRRVTGSRFGVLGLGRIGRAIADRCSPFGEVGYWSRGAKKVNYSFFATPAELARWADVLVVACAATPETAKLVDRPLLEALGSSGVLVNVSRGSVVDEAAVIAALEEGTLAGAALDVFENEPHVPEVLRASERTLLTPHIGSATSEARRAMADIVLANIDAWLAGESLRTPVR